MHTEEMQIGKRRGEQRNQEEKQRQKIGIENSKLVRLTSLSIFVSSMRGCILY